MIHVISSPSLNVLYSVSEYVQCQRMYLTLIYTIGQKFGITMQGCIYLIKNTVK